MTAGVALLAAGKVIFSRGAVHGLTTGAGMWLAGAVGLACGLGLWQIATFAACMVLGVLGLLQGWDGKLVVPSVSKGATVEKPPEKQPSRAQTIPSRTDAS